MHLYIQTLILAVLILASGIVHENIQVIVVKLIPDMCHWFIVLAVLFCYFYIYKKQIFLPNFVINDSSISV